MLWTDEISRDLSLRWRYPILHSSPDHRSQLELPSDPHIWPPRACYDMSFDFGQSELTVSGASLVLSTWSHTCPVYRNTTIFATHVFSDVSGYCNSNWQLYFVNFRSLGVVPLFVLRLSHRHAITDFLWSGPNVLATYTTWREFIYAK